LRDEEEDFTAIKERFSSLAEELEFKNNKLAKLMQKY
jgi:tetrahydromethanopterin S-methyltransferase subunit G